MRRRSWLFVPGADVIVLELEDFTPPDLRAKARALLIEVPIYAAAKRLLESSARS